MDRMVARMRAGARGRVPVAVFQADCLARGRRLFNRIIKEELVARMQHPFSPPVRRRPGSACTASANTPAWGGANAYHNYTTALAALFTETPAGDPVSEPIQRGTDHGRPDTPSPLPYAVIQQQLIDAWTASTGP